MKLNTNCAKCGAEVSDGAAVCLHCGADLQPHKLQQGGVGNVNSPTVAADDAPSFGRGALGCFIPLLGLILYLADKSQRPKRADSAGIGAIIGCGLLLFFLLPALTFPFFARARETGRRTQCQTHLKQLAFAIYDYTQANGNRLPDFSSPQAIKSALLPYVKEDVFECPSAHEATYSGNVALSGMNHESIADSSQIIMLYDQSDLHLDGRNVLFVGGEVKWLKPDGWERAKQASGLQ